jgi:hypothetical protein
MRKTREIIRVSRPKKADIFVIRTLICMAFALMCAFLIWFIDSDLIGDPFIYTLLTFALIFKLVKMLHVSLLEPFGAGYAGAEEQMERGCAHDRLSR